MQAIRAKTRRWGNSIGVIIPRNIAEKEHIKENQAIDILIVKRTNALKETFGMLGNRLKKSSQEIKDELRSELYDE